MLLLLACVPFREAVLHPDIVPVGMDVTQHYSREAVIRRAMQTTWIPLWNPYEFSGFPIQADLQTGVFYPPSVVLRLFPIASFLTWTMILHVWIFGVGAYVLCRVFGSGRGASLMAAIGLMLGGITIPRVYAGHLDVLRTVAWVPLTLALAFESLDRESIAPRPAAVFVLAVEVLAGFLQLVVYTVLTIALYAAYTAIWPRSGRRSGRAATARAIQLVVMVLLVVGVTAFQLLPSSRLVMTAGRAGGIPLHNAIESALDLRQLGAIMFAPVSEGDIPRESWEVSAYIGCLPALLAPFALLSTGRRRRLGFFVILGGLALSFATGGYLFALHHSYFPMFRIPGRFMCFWAISVGVLGAAALDSFIEWTRTRSPALATAGRAAPLLATVVMLADVLLYDAHFVHFHPLRDQFVGSVPFKPSEFGRVLSVCEGALYTSELTALGVPSVDGYNSYFLGDYAHLAERVRGDPPADQRTAFPRMGEPGTVQDLGALSVLNATELVSCTPLDMPGLELVAHTDRFYVYRNHRASGRVAVACPDPRSPDHDLGICNDGVMIKVEAADTPSGKLRFRITQPNRNLLWLAEPYYPERRAWVDGVPAPIEKTHIALSAMQVDAGTHVVELRFVPATLYWGAAISLGVAALWGAAALLGRRKGESSEF